MAGVPDPPTVVDLIAGELPEVEGCSCGQERGVERWCEPCTAWAARLVVALQDAGYVIVAVDA